MCCLFSNAPENTFCPHRAFRWVHPRVVEDPSESFQLSHPLPRAHHLNFGLTTVPCTCLPTLRSSPFGMYLAMGRPCGDQGHHPGHGPVEKELVVVEKSE